MHPFLHQQKQRINLRSLQQFRGRRVRNWRNSSNRINRATKRILNPKKIQSLNGTVPETTGPTNQVSRFEDRAAKRFHGIIVRQTSFSIEMQNPGTFALTIEIAEHKDVPSEICHKRNVRWQYIQKIRMSDLFPSYSIHLILYLQINKDASLNCSSFAPPFSIHRH